MVAGCFWLVARLSTSCRDEPRNVRSLGVQGSGLTWNTLELASSSQEERACLLYVNPCLPEVNVSQREMDISLTLTLLGEFAPSCGN